MSALWYPNKNKTKKPKKEKQAEKLYPLPHLKLYFSQSKYICSSRAMLVKTKQNKQKKSQENN